MGTPAPATSTPQADAGYTAALAEFADTIAQLGVTVRQGTLPAGWWGAYDAANHRITLRPRLAPVQCRSTLAHELGHATYRHAGHGIESQEREAEEWAAAHLITEPQRFTDAADQGNLLGFMAMWLRVLPRDLTTYAQARPEQLAAALADVFKTANGQGWGAALPARHTLNLAGMPDTPAPTQALRDLIDDTRGGQASATDLDAALDQLEKELSTRRTRAVTG